MSPPIIDITTDGHVHTRLCNHAVGEMAEYVEKAVERGLRVITFLEHLEAEIRYQPRSWLEKEEFDFYFREGERLKRQYQGIIEIRLGVETGYNPDAPELLREKLARYPWDRIGISCHFHRHGEVHLNLLSRRRESLEQLATLGVDAVVTRYFNALLAALEAIDCHVLCHLDAVLRHYPGIRFNAGHRRQIAILLDAMQAKGVALEINTSGFDYRGSPFPAPWIIVEALARNIPLSAGSDAHRPEDVGRHFDRLPEYLEHLLKY
jgi:histidinol-phosphatase (PHP family)